MSESENKQSLTFSLFTISVTGTFGGSDFLVSVMGEVGDKLSSSTVNDLNAKFDDAKNQKDQKGNGVELIKALMSKMGGGGNNQDVDSQLENVEQIRKNAINIDPYVKFRTMLPRICAYFRLRLSGSVYTGAKSHLWKFRRSSSMFFALETVSSRVSKQENKAFIVHTDCIYTSRYRTYS